MPSTRNSPEYFSWEFNKAKKPGQYANELLEALDRPLYDMPAAATEAAIRGGTPFMNMPAGATESLIRGVPSSAGRHGMAGLFSAMLARGR